MDEDLSFKGNNPGAVRYGNYINYYKFHPPETRIDSLLNVPSNIWDIKPNNRQIVALDIGCNSGDLTKSLCSFYTKVFSDYKIVILGIDIDSKLIDRANENHKQDNVSFQCLNIMNANAQDILMDFLKKFDKPTFDIITCFSTTMWIHLNNGDDGLKNFLSLISQLSSLLIIEPQPWSRYREAVRRLKKESETFPQYENLKIRSNVEQEIENIILKFEGSKKIYETASLGWARKVLFYHIER